MKASHIYALLPLGALALAGCGAPQPAAGASPATVTATVTVSSTPTPSALATLTGAKYTDPLVMVAKVQAAGFGIKDCGKPVYDISHALAVVCQAPDINEGVRFSVFDRPEDQAASVKLSEAQGGKVFEGQGWTIEAYNRQATLDRVKAALVG